MSFHIEWERLAGQAYDMLGKDAQAAIALALVRTARQGITDDAQPGQGGQWTLRAGDHIIVFTENEFDLYLVAIEPA
ncbi:hypothetical protein [Actinomadura sp. BRA 177]|uniref:hypothetical protein n=1 Tax=Actinomadura sp. BRA 177 TaxID=2745202 RepID=UPI00159529A6|nr:hypothetical protein [Actinomadura sp. BRA 177]NVI86073.1 hypothetical protein [Actinomadura sp. BRA 177]